MWMRPSQVHHDTGTGRGGHRGVAGSRTQGPKKGREYHSISIVVMGS